MGTRSSVGSSSGGEGDRGSVFRPVQTPRVSALLADQLRELILSGALESGSRLSPEHVLCREMGVGRSSVREAIRILEAEGLLVVTSDRLPPLIVAPDARFLSHSMRIFVKGTGIRLHTLLGLRALIEPECADLAAKQHTDSDLEVMRSLNIDMEKAIHNRNSEAYVDANLRWHMAVVGGAHNHLLTAVMHACGDLIRRATRAYRAEDVEVQMDLLRAHDRVTDAIENGDGEAARRRMIRHLDAYIKRVSSFNDDLL